MGTTLKHLGISENEVEAFDKQCPNCNEKRKFEPWAEENTYICIICNHTVELDLGGDNACDSGC